MVSVTTPENKSALEVSVESSGIDLRVPC